MTCQYMPWMAPAVCATPGNPVGVVGGWGAGVAALVLHHRPRLQRAPGPQQLRQHPHLLLERCHLQGLLLECP